MVPDTCEWAPFSGFTHPFLLQAAIQLNSDHKGIPHFLSHPIPLSESSPHCIPASVFQLQHILSFAHCPKPQHPMHSFLPVHWHWTPQSSFQSLNTDLACGETDSCYRVLRKIFCQDKLITSVTAISFLTEMAPPPSQFRILPKTTQRHVTCSFSLF